MSMLNNRNNGIDLLRGFSILSVILLHCSIHIPLANNLLPQKLSNIIFRSGYWGVITFFVISGFLITTTSLKRWSGLQNISCSEFYRLRFARIMPCLLALLLILSMLDIIGVKGFTIHTTSLTQALFSALTFQINWLEAKTNWYLPANWDVLWSLSVEEMFYLFFPLLCVLLKKPRYFVIALFVFVVLGPFARTTFTSNELWIDRSYLACMDGIAIGCLAALLAHRFSFKLNNKMFFLALSLYSGLSLCLFIFIFRKQAFDLGLSKIGINVTIFEIGCGLMLIAMQARSVLTNRLGSFWSAPFRWFGRHSYEIYLTHSFFVITIANVLAESSHSFIFILTIYAIILALSGVAGQVVSVYFSEPMNKLIRHKLALNFFFIRSKVQ